MPTIKLNSDRMRFISEEMAEIENIQERLDKIESALNLVRCKDCKHRPTGTGANHDLEFPDDKCPCQCAGDYWYSWMPDDNWFCANAERSEDGGKTD